MNRKEELMKNLADVVPTHLTNSDDKYKWLDKMFHSAATDDGKVIVAAIALLIDEVITLQESVGQLQDDH
jgi:hypothetical protein